MQQKVKFRNIEFNINKVFQSNEFFQFDILPSLMFIKNSQFCEANENENTMYEAYIAYSLVFQWIGFYIELAYNRKIRND